MLRHIFQRAMRLAFIAWGYTQQECEAQIMTQERPAKPRKRIARKPLWIADVEDQRARTMKFAKKLREIEKVDPAITVILRNERILRDCAAQVRLYGDLAVTAHVRRERERRGRQQVARLNSAIKGITEAMEFYAEFGDRTATSQLQQYRQDLAEKLQRSKQAYSSKRHGRDRDHTILIRLQTFLEKHAGQVTNATLATLVNKAMEVDGQAGSERFTEETVRKNLRAFRSKNPAMMTLLARESEGVRNQNDGK